MVAIFICLLPDSFSRNIEERSSKPS